MLIAGTDKEKEERQQHEIESNILDQALSALWNFTGSSVVRKAVMAQQDFIPDLLMEMNAIRDKAEKCEPNLLVRYICL
jgi:hypothetical protein